MKGNLELVEKAILAYEEMGYWEPLTLGQQLSLWAKKYQDRVALVAGAEQLTYSQLDQQADEMAAGFLGLGLQKGDHVVVQLPNRNSFVIVCFALFRLGLVPILTLPAHRESELEGIFSLAKPVAYIIPDTFLGFDYPKMAKQLLQKHPEVKHLIIDGPNHSGLNLADMALPPVAMESPSSRDTALLLLSGGTTAIPKLIPRTHADYAYNAKAAAARCGLNQESTYLAVLPIAHNFPLCCPGVLGTLSVGGKIVLAPTASCDEAFPLIEKEKVTITALVPAMVNLWLEVLEWDTEGDISSLELVQVGGAVLDVNLAKRIMPEMKCKLQQVFGTAEGIICMTKIDDPDQIIHSCQGRPISEGDELKIVDQDGRVVADGQYGELLARGPYTIRNYYKAPQANAESFTPDGFYRTGDKARFTPEGNLQIGGRVKEQINRAGEKIMPAEVEAYLCLHQDIKEAALIGLPDKDLGQRSCAYLLTENKKLTLSQMHDFLKERGVAQYKRPDQIEFVTSWPLTSVGKVDKNELQRRALELNEQAKNNRKSYLEEQINFEGEAYWTAAKIAESGIFSNYLLYENKDEVSLGLGIYALLSVDTDYTTLKINDETLYFANGDLSESIGKAFAEVPLDNWRAYGNANFGLSRYNYNLPLWSEDKCLLKLFIPEVEVRFTKNNILLRVLSKEKFTEISDIIKKILRIEQNEHSENSLKQRVREEKLSVPQVNTHDSENYQKIVAAAIKEIKERKYQKVILSRKIPLNCKLDMIASYLAGRRVNSPARSFLFRLGGLNALGFSPETVVEVDALGTVSTFPLAGTRSCGGDEQEKQQLKEELLNDPKEIAEHAISVKLAYEEMKRICDAKTIMVNDYMTVVNRGTVQHLASRLKGRLKAGCNSWHAFNALFPAVTASGIPKKESIDAIGRLEPNPRNLYSGCVMTVDSDGALDAALVLRSIYQNKKMAWLHAGAGIVELSKPGRELEETCEKLSSFSEQLVCAKQNTGA